MRNLWIIVLLLAIANCGSLLALEAGAASMEITPRTGLPMMGFNGRIAKDVLDPLHVRAVVFRSDSGSVALVVYDLLFPFEEGIGRMVARRIQKRTGVGQVIFNATHTHSGPRIHWDTPLSEGEDLSALPDFEQMIIDKTVETVATAWSRLQPARLGTGWGTADISYNRLEKLPGGGASMKWANHEKVPMGPVDQTLGVIRIDDLSGNPLAILVNYACHPVIHGKPDANLMYSADYPGVLCRKVNQSLPGHPECIFFNGCCGNLNPYYAHSVDNPKPRLEEAGGELADEVLRVAGGIMTREYPQSEVRSRMEHFPAEGGWNAGNVMKEIDDTVRAKSVVAGIDKYRNNLDLPYSIVLIGSDIGFIGLPGEFFWEFQSQLRLMSPVSCLFITGNTNESNGYFPTIQAAALGGYGANDEAVHTAPGTGEHLIIDALVSLDEMLGKLRDVPSSGKFDYKR